MRLSAALAGFHRIACEHENIACDHARHTSRAAQQHSAQQHCTCVTRLYTVRTVQLYGTCMVLCVTVTVLDGYSCVITDVRSHRQLHLKMQPGQQVVHQELHQFGTRHASLFIGKPTPKDGTKVW